jgi:hypothetical protein
MATEQLPVDPFITQLGSRTDLLAPVSYLEARVSKNVLVSTGESYLTPQEAIDNAFPAGTYRDTVALRGYQSSYQLGENNLIVDATSASFSPDDGANIGLFAGSTVAFQHALVGGNYAGGIVYSSHNGGTANKLTVTDVLVSDSTKLNFILSTALGSGLVDVVDFVRVWGVKTILAANTYGNGLVNFSGNTYQNHRPVRLNLYDCDLSSTAGPLFAGIAPRGTEVHLYGATKVSGSTASNLQLVRSADAAGVNPVAFTDAELIIDHRSATGSGTGRDPYDVDTAKRKAVVDAAAAIVVETDDTYYGKKFVDEVYGPDQPAFYQCLPSAPAQDGSPTVWKWFRSDIL